ncbi:Delta(12)-oleate desaturase [Bienertia sinuspersici]
MEEKQLNFNQPLLSVRRGSSVTAPPESKRKANDSHTTLPPLPYYKSELKSGPIRNPGVVPFKWERMPGRPKDEKKAQKKTLESASLVPKLPPGRVANHVQKQTDEVRRDSPTYLKYRSETSIPHSLENSSPDKVLSEVEGSEKEECKDVSSSEDENVTFVDAPETLSRTESFFNCSVSGVSELDGPESSGAFSDPQTRDFMMGRFLPAAKAVASETPPNASRRNHSVAREQEKPVPKMIKWKKQPPHYNTVPDTLHDHINMEEKYEDYESDHSDEPEHAPAKLCGLLPSFCMLNPIPGMRDHVEVIPTVRSIGLRINGGGMKRTAIQHAPVPSKESLMNGHLGCHGLVREKGVSPQSFLDKEKRSLGLPELESVAHLQTGETMNLINPPIEKTVYVDSERMIESRNSISSSSESRGRNPSVDYSLQDIKSFCSKSSETTDSSAVTAKSCQNVIGDLNNLQKDDHNVINVTVDVKKPQKPDVKSMIQFENCNSALALTPLLPKSPSESWLSRTLPSMGSRNQASKPYSANYTFRSSPVDPKRERLLKNSHVQNMLFQSAGELAPILEN